MNTDGIVHQLAELNKTLQGIELQLADLVELTQLVLKERTKERTK